MSETIGFKGILDMPNNVKLSRLTNKVCVVTGAAGGIGEATAERLASEGARVVGVDLLEHSVGELSLQADLTDEAQVQGVYSKEGLSMSAC